MEAMNSPITQRPRFIDASPFSQSSSSSSCRSSASFVGFRKTIQSGDCRSIGCGTAYSSHGFRSRTSFLPIRAAAHEKDDTDADQGTPEHGLRLASEDSPLIADNRSRVGGKGGSSENFTASPVMVGISGGSRSGLLRPPVSGGVQSATSAHDLPRPALAVRNLMEQVRFAHLCTVMSRMHHRRQGYPFGSLVDFAPDSMGHPIFSFSPLAIHTRNLLADPRCTLVVQVPGWSGVTIFGDVYPLPADKQEWAHKHYIAKHQQGASQQWGNFYYYRMESISDIYFIGGFGTVAWVDVNEYETLEPDKIAVNGGEQHLKALNAMFSKPLKELLSADAEIDDAALISIDSKGIDVRVRQGAQFHIERIPFQAGHEVETLEEAKAAIQKLINKGSRLNLVSRG
ncbi:hypothetical protein EJ110_NYTH15579 [Nymphaea thermarum]|nr:hypothetical protein EJ110_NYTH15579 [Nymphaea thermarum]